MVVEVKPAHIRANMVKCTTAGMVKLTALGMASTTMNALVSTITLAKVREEVVQAEDPLLVEQQAAIREVYMPVDMMESNGTVSTIELTHGTRTSRVVVIVTDTQLHTGDKLVGIIDVVADITDMEEVAEQLQPPLQLPPLLKHQVMVMEVKKAGVKNRE